MEREDLEPSDDDEYQDIDWSAVEVGVRSAGDQIDDDGTASPGAPLVDEPPSRQVPHVVEQSEAAACRVGDGPAAEDEEAAARRIAEAAEFRRQRAAMRSRAAERHRALVRFVLHSGGQSLWISSSDRRGGQAAGVKRQVGLC